MNLFGGLLKRLRASRGWDVSTMAGRLGITVDRLFALECGMAFPPAVERRRWARTLGFASLAEFDHQWRDSWARVTAAHRDGWIPIINKAPAGPVTDYEEYGIDSGVGFEYVPRTAGLPRGLLFAVIVCGDSMRPLYHDGDLVIFHPLKPDQPLADGTPVFVRFGYQRQHGCTFKNFYRLPNGGFELRPENPACESLFTCSDEIDRIAIAIERRPGYCPRAQPLRLLRDEYAQD